MGCVFLGEALGAGCEEVVGDDLDGAGDGDGDEGSEDAKQGGADKNRDEDNQRGDLDSAAVDDGLDQVVFDLLVHEDRSKNDDGVSGAVGEVCDGYYQDRCDGGADKWDEVSDCDDHAECERVGDVEDQESRGYEGACDE